MPIASRDAVRNRLLLVDDEKWFYEDLEVVLGDEYDILHVRSIADLRKVVAPDRFDVALADMYLEDGKGHDALRVILASDPLCPVIMVSQFAAVDDAIRALREGAAYFLEKRQPGDFIRGVIEREIQAAAERRRLAENLAMEKAALGPIIAESPAMKEMLRSLTDLERSPFLLLWGELGVGKEYLARWLHFRGTERRPAHFQVVHCGGGDASVSRALFGAPPQDGREGLSGALGTGAGATIYVDDLARLSGDLQMSIEDALEKGWFAHPRTGAPTPILSRVIFAATSDPEQLVREGKLDRKLHILLRPVQVRVPSLRERGPDIGLLIDRTLERILRKTGIQAVVTSEARTRLCEQAWPDNLGGLEDTLRGAAFRAAAWGTEIDPGLVDELLPSSSPPPGSLDERVLEFKKRTILQALENTQWNVTAACALLSVHRVTLYRLMKQFKLARPGAGDGGGQ